jgi:hypothetical protein
VGQHSSASASRLLGLDGFEVLAADIVDGEWQLAVQTTATMVGCRGCGTRAELHGRRTIGVRDLPAGGRPVVLAWRKRPSWRPRHVGPLLPLGRRRRGSRTVAACPHRQSLGGRDPCLPLDRGLFQRADRGREPAHQKVKRVGHGFRCRRQSRGCAARSRRAPGGWRRTRTQVQRRSRPVPVGSWTPCGACYPPLRMPAGW